MKTFKLEILSIEKSIYSGYCESLIVPTEDGYCGIQAGFNASIISISDGIIHVKVNGQELLFESGKGIAITKSNETTILLD